MIGGVESTLCSVDGVTCDVSLTSDIRVGAIVKTDVDAACWTVGAIDWSHSPYTLDVSEV